MNAYKQYVRLETPVNLVFQPAKKCEYTALQLQSRFQKTVFNGNGFRVQRDKKHNDAFYIYTSQYVFAANFWFSSSPPNTDAPLTAQQLLEVTGFRIHNCWDMKQYQTMESSLCCLYVDGGKHLNYITDNLRFCTSRHRGMAMILAAMDLIPELPQQGVQKEKHHFFDVQHAIIEAEKAFELNEGVTVTYSQVLQNGRHCVFHLKPLQDKTVSAALQKHPTMRLTLENLDVFGSVTDYDPEENILHFTLWQEGGALPAEGQLHKCLAFAYSAVEDVAQNNTEGTAYDFTIGLLCDDHIRKQCKNGVTLQFATADNRQQIGTVDSYNSSTGALRVILRGMDRYAIPNSGVLRKCLSPAFNHQQLALKRIHKGMAQNNTLHKLLLGETGQTITIHTPYTPPAGMSMNKRQQEAVEKAINTEDFLLIQGPPGSGKTTIIIEMVHHFVSKGLRVLICSQSNHAVDNVLKKCLDLYHDSEKRQRIHCLRIGNSEKVEDTLQGNLRRPLTQKIQDDLSARSKTAYLQYRERAEARKVLLAQRQKEIAVITLLLAFCDKNVQHIERLRSYAKRSIMAFLFGGKPCAQAKAHLEAICLSYQKSVFSLARMLNHTMINTQTELENLFDQLNNRLKLLKQLKALAQAHPTRIRWLLKSEQQQELAAMIEGQAAQIAQQLNSLRNYGGNPFANDLQIKADSNGYTLPIVTKYRADIDRLLRQSDADAIAIHDALTHWQEVLVNDNKSIGEALLKSIKIVGSTCIGTSTKAEFDEMTYDVAIVDEAGQIAMHDLLVPLVKAKKIILIGDHVQLPPMANEDFARYYMANHYLKDHAAILNEQHNKDIAFFYPFRSVGEVFSKSLFELLICNPQYEDHTVKLNTQYRMHSVIANYISENFYQKEYLSQRPDTDFALPLADLPESLYFVDTRYLPGKAEHPGPNGESYHNETEADICAAYLEMLITAMEEYPVVKKALLNKFGQPDIGVITAYSAQISCIRNKLKEKLARHYSEEQSAALANRISINTLDSFQGMENKVILYSFVRSNCEEKANNRKVYSIGFMNDVRRLNVLMTRAQCRLIMVGDSETLTSTAARTKHDKTKAADYYSRLIQYCQRHGKYLTPGKEA